MHGVGPVLRLRVVVRRLPRLGGTDVVDAWVVIVRAAIGRIKLLFNLQTNVRQLLFDRGRHTGVVQHIPLLRVLCGGVRLTRLLDSLYAAGPSSGGLGGLRWAFSATQERLDVPQERPGLLFFIQGPLVVPFLVLVVGLRVSLYFLTVFGGALRLRGAISEFQSQFLHFRRRLERLLLRRYSTLFLIRRQ